jgi:CheY-like chemotaxis protein
MESSLDPQWQTAWGRSGGIDDFFSLGSASFDLRPGQRILVQGSVLPSDGLKIGAPEVTVLAENEPIEVLAAKGRIGDTAHLNKHVVQVEGYVDRQEPPDGLHVRLDLVVEGRPVIGRLSPKAGTPAPEFEGSLVRLKGAKAMERLRQMDPEVCAIVSSGYSNDPVMANYRSHGFGAIVPKPYEIRVLSDAIGALLRERRA